MDATLKITDCARGHLSRFQAYTITSTIPPDRGAAKRRAEELWGKLKRILAAGKVVCAQVVALLPTATPSCTLHLNTDLRLTCQVRELWSEEERIHLRPGHFWLAVLADADGHGSPIIAGPFRERTYWPPQKGESGWEGRFDGIARQRYDAGDCALLLLHYYHRTPDDPESLTFVGEEPAKGEKLVVNSREVRGVTGNPLGLKPTTRVKSSG